MNKFNFQRLSPPSKKLSAWQFFFPKIYSFPNLLSVGILLILAWTLFWTPNYFTPDTFMNMRDSIFPFLPGKFLSDYYYIWFESGKDALGFAEGYHAGVITLYYFLIAKAQTLGMPLWILNRLFFLIPIWLFLIAGYYFILSFNSGRFKHLSAVLCSFFIVTAPPQAVIAPRPTLALAGFVLAFACIQRFLDYRKIHHLFLFAIAFFFMTSMPRYAYLTLILAPPYVILWAFLNKGTSNSLGVRDFFKATGIILIVSSGLNSYTIFPTITFLFDHSSAELMVSTEQYNLRTQEVLNFYKNQTHPLYSLRMIVNNIYSTHTLYFSNPLLVGFSFLIPILMGLGIWAGRQNKSVLAMGFLFFLATTLSILFGTPIYNWIYSNIPGFWILNNPHYLQGAASLPAGVFLSFAFSEISNFLTKKTKRGWNLMSSIWTAGFIVILVLYNGAYIFDWTPKYRRIFTGGELTRQAMGNHLPYFKIPNEYWGIEQVIRYETKPRILVFPILKNGYMRYSWHEETVMPEILYSMTPYRIGGHTADQTQPLRLVQKYILNGNEQKAAAIFSRFKYEYVLLHKDRLPASSYEFQEEYVIVSHFLKGWDSAELVEDNKFFSLYKIRKRQ